MILGGVAILLALDALRAGAGRAASIALSLPVSLLVYSLFQKASFIDAARTMISSPMIEAGVFGAIAVVVYLIVRRMGLELVDSGGGPLQALLASTAATIILLIVWLQVPALESIWNFGDRVETAFSEGLRLWWLLGSLIALAFSRS